MALQPGRQKCNQIPVPFSLLLLTSSVTLGWLLKLFDLQFLYMMMDRLNYYFPCRTAASHRQETL